jgi:hypothetical protein
MKTFPAAESAWAARLAARLRVLQTTCAEDEADMRLELLQEEVARALREIAPAQRAGYIEALEDKFPDFGSSSMGAPAAGAAAPAEDEIEFPTMPPEVLMADLLDAAPTLSAETRAEYGRRLAAAGFLVTSAPAAAAPAFDLPADARARFALSANQKVDQARAMRLFGLMADLTIALDQLAWSVWKQLAPQSIIRREAGAAGDFRKLAALYLSGDPEVATPQLAQLLDKTRKLVAGLLAGMGPAGSAFARNYLARFSPETIENRSAGGFFSNADQRCWRAYIELFAQLNEQSVEREVLNAIVQYAEGAILGPNRPPSATGGAPAPPEPG